MMHRFHPDVERGDPETAILFDDCDRCAEHAKNLFDLDRENLRLLYDRAKEPVYRGTANEIDAMHRLYRMFVLNERLGLDA